jgi:hypothetical protein
MTPGDAQPSPTVHVIHEMEVAQTALGQAGSQQILLGAPRDDQSPLLFGVTRVRAGRTTQLIEHDTAEVAYVIASPTEPNTRSSQGRLS